ncbi:GerMN domain-containing protein [Thalassobacillus pellis]|uniref:GerMN domain-containing protein n=1 Tax=Thalassobacillus pellis TaxID=748008 RepID=UPI00196070C5|nr:GerMN domain-containing protein [Thalassobacillus pellis]MBM7552426.1 hypothetical protein [Thalassobacillus pellis]
MSNKKNADKKLEHALKNMPEIKDRQTKDDLYRKVSSRSEDDKTRKNKPWAIPVVASATVILLLALIIPMLFMNQQELKNREYSTDQAAQENSNKDSGDAARILEDAGEEAQLYEQKIASESHLVLYDDPDTQLVHIGVPGKNAEHIVPLSIIIPNHGSITDTWSSLRNLSSQLESLGLGNYPLSNIALSINKEEGKGTALFMSGYRNNGGSSADQVLVKSIQSAFRPYGIKQVKLKKEGGGPVEVGHYGELDQLQVEPEPAVYKLYQYSPNHPTFLISTETRPDLKIDEAIQAMHKSEGKLISSPIPENVRIQAKKIDERTLEVNINEGSLQQDQQTLNMVEAVLATAGTYHMEKVQFTGNDIKRIGPYNLTRPLDVPIAVNPLDYIELKK